ncbi:MAG: hypothetical protein ACREJ3_02910 [Polyangiaceae bacterium]
MCQNGVCVQCQHTKDCPTGQLCINGACR